MVHNPAHPSVLQGIDPKRIAANALAITVHLLALALLLMPTRWSPAVKPATPDEVIVVVPERVPPRDITPTTAPPPRNPVPVVVPIVPPTIPTTTVAPSPDAVPVFETGTELAVPTVEGPATDSFEVGPPGVETLAYDVAPAPRYPRLAMRDRAEGTVLLRVLVDEAGQPQSVEIERGSGNRHLDKAARDQVLAHWRFHPAERQGRRIAAYALVPIRFTLP